MPNDDLKVFLADRDAPCSCCGYNLRGLAVDTCPECHAEIRLGISGKQPSKRLAQYVGAMLLLSAAQFGLSGGYYIWVILGSTISYTSGWRMVVYGIAFAVLGVVCLFTCVRLNLGWRTPGLRSELLTVAMLVAVTVLGAFSLLMIASFVLTRFF